MRNTGSIDITVPAPKLIQPNEGDGYLVVALELFKGVEVLSTS